MTRKDVQALLTETNHVLGLDDVDDILRLESLAAKLLAPEEAAECDMLALPVACGNVLLHPPTMAKAKWYDECVLKWFEEEPDFCWLVLGFALCEDNTRQSLWALAAADETRKRVESWWKTLDCTPEAFARAIAGVLPDRGYDTEGGDPVRYGPTCGLLAHEYGGTPEYWFYEADMPVVTTLLDDYSRRAEAEAAAARKAKSGGPANKPIAPRATPSMKWQKAYREALIELRAKWQKTQK